MQSHVFPSDLEKGMAKTATSFDDDPMVFRVTRLKAECEELYKQLLIVGDWMAKSQSINTSSIANFRHTYINIYTHTQLHKHRDGV